jgi:hypothetical protein
LKKLPALRASLASPCPAAISVVLSLIAIPLILVRDHFSRVLEHRSRIVDDLPHFLNSLRLDHPNIWKI